MNTLPGGEGTGRSPEDVEEIISAIEVMVDHITGREPLLTSRVEEAPRQYAAASLSRGCAILRSGIAAFRAAQVEAIGVIARAAWESWLVGAFLLYGGKSALIRMEAEQLRQNKNLARLNDLPPHVLDERLAELIETERLRQRVEEGRAEDDLSPIKFNKLTLEQVAKETGPLIAAATGQPADLTAAYDMFYRSHSAWDTHGVQAIDARIVLHEDEDRIELQEGSPWLEPEKPLAIAATYLGFLAGLVHEIFGIDTDELGDLQAVLLGLMGTGVGLGSDLGQWRMPPRG